MTIDLMPYFKKYEALVEKVDRTFEKVSAEHGGLVKCREKCSDCCHAIFDVSLLEAIYINHHFHDKVKGVKKETILEKANRADRKIYRIKRSAFKSHEAGEDEVVIMGKLAEERVRCPLLDENDLCILYEHRPVTCRTYGIPTSIGGRGHTCGLSGFTAGEQYPTVNLDVIHQQLYEMAKAFVNDIGSKYVKMADILVPVSMALLTEYNETYLGIDGGDHKKEEGTKE